MIAKYREEKRLIALANVAEYETKEYDDFLNGKTKPETATGAGAESFDEQNTDETGDAE